MQFRPEMVRNTFCTGVNCPFFLSFCNCPFFSSLLQLPLLLIRCHTVERNYFCVAVYYTALKSIDLMSLNGKQRKVERKQRKA